MKKNAPRKRLEVLHYAHSTGLELEHENARVRVIDGVIHFGLQTNKTHCFTYGKGDERIASVFDLLSETFGVETCSQCMTPICRKCMSTYTFLDFCEYKEIGPIAVSLRKALAARSTASFIKHALDFSESWMRSLDDALEPWIQKMLIQLRQHRLFETAQKEIIESYIWPAIFKKPAIAPERNPLADEAYGRYTKEIHQTFVLTKHCIYEEKREFWLANRCEKTKEYRTVGAFMLAFYIGEGLFYGPELVPAFLDCYKVLKHDSYDKVKTEVEGLGFEELLEVKELRKTIYGEDDEPGSFKDALAGYLGLKGKK